jgi:hypothetical protein
MPRSSSVNDMDLVFLNSNLRSGAGHEQTAAMERRRLVRPEIPSCLSRHLSIELATEKTLGVFDHDRP